MPGATAIVLGRDLWSVNSICSRRCAEHVGGSFVAQPAFAALDHSDGRLLRRIEPVECW